MTQAVTQILAKVEQHAADRAELRPAVNECLPMSDDLTDEDFAVVAAEIFRMLDEEEAQRA